MSAEVIPFPISRIGAPPGTGSAEIVHIRSAEHARTLIREGDDIYDAHSGLLLGKVAALVGERLVYTGRWSGPRVVALADVRTYGELPWQLRP